MFLVFQSDDTSRKSLHGHGGQAACVVQVLADGGALEGAVAVHHIVHAVSYTHLLRMGAAGAKDGKVISANIWGKVKTVLQMLSIIFYFFGTALCLSLIHMAQDAADGLGMAVYRTESGEVVMAARCV